MHQLVYVPHGRYLGKVYQPDDEDGSPDGSGGHHREVRTVHDSLSVQIIQEMMLYKMFLSQLMAL